MKLIARFFIFCFFQCPVHFSFGQYKITFLVKQLPVLHSAEHLFIAGNFNSWNPGSSSPVKEIIDVDAKHNENA